MDFKVGDRVRIKPGCEISNVDGAYDVISGATTMTIAVVQDCMPWSSMFLTCYN